MVPTFQLYTTIVGVHDWLVNSQTLLSYCKITTNNKELVGYTISGHFQMLILDALKKSVRATPNNLTPRRIVSYADSK